MENTSHHDVSDMNSWCSLGRETHNARLTGHRAEMAKACIVLLLLDIIAMPQTLFLNYKLTTRDKVLQQLSFVASTRPARGVEARRCVYKINQKYISFFPLSFNGLHLTAQNRSCPSTN